MESVVGLLATVTRPLANLKDRKKASDEPSSSTSNPEQAAVEQPTISPDAVPVEPDPATEIAAPVVVENPSETPVSAEQSQGEALFASLIQYT